MTDFQEVYDLYFQDVYLGADTGKEVPLASFYLGCPDRGDAVLLWSAEEDYPLATPEMEKEHLYQFVFR